MNRGPFMNTRKQDGAILIVALIMLLLVTIIGLASMRGTSLQERMAGNLRDQELALQAAEAALRRGEARVTTKFEANTLSTLSVADENGSYASFPGVAKDPTYTLRQLATLRTSTEVGVPTDEEGTIVRITATGYGMAQDAANTPSTTSELSSVFLVEQ
ncbi:type IV pilus assembly protein PilX [Ectopseudomonas oleovorans]|uniref:Type IV pilus assembly protein PilX n=2 Tax=Pseudomonadales TaxID=72274 RepID=W6R129_ECTO5|nr:type IV pilus assembly protein PilX [Pseudomonas oleovorans CECT 5344]CDR92598.1 type IV pilus assembly protein PilX [Pseudomonas oleovorans]